MLSLKDKLLQAGIVTAEQVKKVEDEQAVRERRDGARRERARGARTGRGGQHDDDDDERVAAREHQVEEAQRWRQRIEQLKSAGKSEQYDVIRGWVTRHRIDDKAAVLSEQAARFHFAKEDGAIGHLTVEPEVQARLTSGEAGVIAFMGFNGVEHAVVPADLARDIHAVKPEWVRALVGVTDQEAPAVASPAPSAEETPPSDTTPPEERVP